MWPMVMIFFALAALTSASAQERDVNIMPRQLVELGQKHGCQQVNDFFAVDGMINPPYVYGYLPGPKEKSAAFWCQVDEKGERRFLLMIMAKEEPPQELARCPRQIPSLNRPKGLDLYRNPSESLEKFVYVDAPTRTGPKNVKLTHNAIRSEYDGVGSIFYCYGGRWLVRQQD